MAVGAHFWAVVPAAGSGSRMQSNLPKQYLTINGVPVLSHTLSVLLNCPQINGVVLALSENDTNWPAMEESKHPRVFSVVGGNTRAESVLNALVYLESRTDVNDWVLVHDAARPCLREETLNRLIKTVEGGDSDSSGAILAVPVHDTMKRANNSLQIMETIDRQELWHAQTPQCFKLFKLRRAIAKGLEQGLKITDEASAMEASGYHPLLVEGRSDNIKITRPSDLALAAFFLSQSG